MSNEMTDSERFYRIQHETTEQECANEGHPPHVVVNSFTDALWAVCRCRKYRYARTEEDPVSINQEAQ